MEQQRLTSIDSPPIKPNNNPSDNEREAFSSQPLSQQQPPFQSEESPTRIKITKNNIGEFWREGKLDDIVHSLIEASQEDRDRLLNALAKAIKEQSAEAMHPIEKSRLLNREVSFRFHLHSVYMSRAYSWPTKKPITPSNGSISDRIRAIPNRFSDNRKQMSEFNAQEKARFESASKRSAEFANEILAALQEIKDK